MRYPIDQCTADTLFGHLIASDRAQRQTILALIFLLKEAMEEVGGNVHDSSESGWYAEAQKLLKLQEDIERDHENRLFNEKNGIAEKPPKMKVSPEVVKADYSDISINPMKSTDDIDVGKDLSEEEIASHFRENYKRNTVKDGVDLSKTNPFQNMSLEQIKEWEEKQNNSNDIYKIKARVANLARSGGASLTPVGEMMVNTFVHVVKDLYDFAEVIPDKNIRINLIERIRKHEGMPGNLISATSVNLRNKK